MFRIIVAFNCLLPLIVSTTLTAALPLGNLGVSHEEKLAIRETLLEKIEASPNDLDLRFELGLNETDLALNDDEDASRRALQIFDDIYKADPNRVDALAFYGTAATIRAKYAYIPFKMYWVKRGFRALDDAVALRPDDINVRLIRAANSSQVPNFLGRSALAYEDFEWLKARMEKEPEAFDASTRQAMFYFAAQFALRQNNKECLVLLEEALAIPGPEGLQEEITAFYEKALERFDPADKPQSRSPL